MYHKFKQQLKVAKKHQEELKNEIQRLLKLLNMKSSIYNIETRECTNGKAYIMECSPRGGGNRLSEMIRYMTNIDLIDEVVRAAIGEPLIDLKQEEIKENFAEIILHSEKEGTFKELWTSEKISDNIVEKDLWVKEGTKVGGFAGANEAIGTLVLRFKNQEELKRVIESQEEYVKVILS